MQVLIYLHIPRHLFQNNTILLDFVLEKFVLVVKRVKIPVMEMVAPPLFANHKKAIGMSLVW